MRHCVPGSVTKRQRLKKHLLHNLFFCVVSRQEARRAFFSQVLFELRAAHFHKIDDYQAIDDVGKRAVDVEGEHLAAAVQVLAEQDGDAFSIGLQIGDGVGKVLDIVEQIGQHARVAAAQAAGTETGAAVRRSAPGRRCRSAPANRRRSARARLRCIRG